MFLGARSQGQDLGNSPYHSTAGQSEQSLSYGMIRSTLHLHVPSLLYLAARNRAEASNASQFSIETLPYDAIKNYVKDVGRILKYKALTDYTEKLSSPDNLDCPQEVFYEIGRAKDISNEGATAYSNVGKMNSETRKMLITNGVSFFPEYRDLKDIRHDIPDSPIDALNTLQRGDINPKNALIKAACLEHPETLAAIITQFPISEHDKQLAFHAAVDHNSLQSCQVLFDHGLEKLDLNKPLFGPGNRDHFLTSAALYNYPDIVTFLLEHGADIHALDAYDLKFIGLDDFHNFKNKAATLRELLKYGADITILNQKDQEEYRQLLAKYPEEPGKNTASSSQQLIQ
jgi:hypothetical protein